MKQVIWIIAVLLGLVAPAAHAQPGIVPPPPAGIVWQVAGAGRDYLYAGTLCGVYELNDGNRWVEVPGLRDIPARRLLRLEGGVLLATTAGWSSGGVWRHEPGGNWERVLDDLNLPLAVAPDNATVYGARVVGSGAVAVVRSTDRGRTWTPTSPSTFAGAASNIAVASDPATGNYVVVLSLLPPRGPTKLLRSPDGGQTWQEIPDPVRPGAGALNGQIFSDPIEPRFYIANAYGDPQGSAVQTRLFRVPVAGEGVEQVTLPEELEQGGLVDLVARGSALFAGGPRGVFVSAERGAAGSWRRLDASLGLGTLFDLAHVPSFTSDPVPTLFAGTSTGVYELEPIYNNWQSVGIDLPTCNRPGRTVYERVPAFPDSADRHYFEQTGHSLSFAFKNYWEANGALPVFGYPLTEEFDERNVDLQRAFTTQYLERERFELHLENAGTPYLVLLGRLGDELLASSGRDWRREDGTDNPFGSGECQRFELDAEVRSVCGPFLQYWRSHGLDFGEPGTSYAESLALFGLPLTAPRMERNADGDEVLTQWFERARFEYHPDNAEQYRVLLGRLGAETLRLRGK